MYAAPASAVAGTAAENRASSVHRLEMTVWRGFAGGAPQKPRV
jgi:hypothetical protein